MTSQISLCCFVALLIVSFMSNCSAKKTQTTKKFKEFLKEASVAHLDVGVNGTQVLSKFNKRKMIYYYKFDYGPVYKKVGGWRVVCQAKVNTTKLVKINATTSSSVKEPESVWIFFKCGKTKKGRYSCCKKRRSRHGCCKDRPKVRRNGNQDSTAGLWVLLFGDEETERSRPFRLIYVLCGSVGVGYCMLRTGGDPPTIEEPPKNDDNDKDKEGDKDKNNDENGKEDDEEAKDEDDGNGKDGDEDNDRVENIQGVKNE